VTDRPPMSLDSRWIELCSTTLNVSLLERTYLYGRVIINTFRRFQHFQPLNAQIPAKRTPMVATESEGMSPRFRPSLDLGKCWCGSLPLGKDVIGAIN